MASTESTNGARENGQQKAMLARHRQSQESETQEKHTHKPSMFPLSYKEGFSQWWTSLTPAVTEQTVLSFMPYLQQSVSPNRAEQQIDNETVVGGIGAPATDPYGARRWHSEQVQLSGRNRSLNEFSIDRAGEDAKNSLVMLHGYGAGLGFFYKNFEALSRLPSWKLYALDMLGMGRSSRPPYRILAKDKQRKIQEAEDWFVDSLEEWRVKRGIEKMTLLGHSLGGYIAVCYALKYPGHLNKLILASPVGIPEDPYAVNESLPEPNDSTLENEFTQTQHETTEGTANPRQGPDGGGTLTQRKRIPRWLTTLWDANVSPFSFVRLSGPLGPRLVSGWTSRRFSHLPRAEADALHDYSYSLFRQRGSGEYALAYILAPGAFARSPLIRRIQGVGRQYLDSGLAAENAIPAPPPTPSLARVRETGIPILLMYGDHDWMDVEGGYAAAAKIKVETEKALRSATEEEKQMENGSVRVSIIKRAGHHLYIDNHEQFNAEILEEMKDVERRQLRIQGRS